MSLWGEEGNFNFDVKSVSGERASINTIDVGIIDSLFTSDGVFSLYSNNVSGTYYGRFAKIGTWEPPVQATPTWNFFDLTALTVGLTDIAGKTATQLWSTSNNISQISFLSSASMANSHVIGYASYGYIPPGLNDGGGGVLDVNGVPTDPDYQELGGFSGALCCESPGHYLEGIGVWVCDSYIYATAAEETAASAATLMSACIMAVHKSNAANTYRSDAFVASSIGSQQTTYAPTNALLVAGGWQYGINLSSGAFNAAHIKFNSDTTITMTESPSILYLNVGVGSPFSASASGVGISGTLVTTGFKLTTDAAAGRILVSDADGDGTWTAAAFDLLSDTSPQLGGTLDINGKYFTNTTGDGLGNFWMAFSAAATAAHHNVIHVDGGANGDGMVKVQSKQTAGRTANFTHNGTDAWFASDYGHLWLNPAAGSMIKINTALDMYGKYVTNTVADGSGNYVFEYSGPNVSDTYNVILAGGNAAGTYGVGILQARYRKSATAIISVYHNSAVGIISTLAGNLNLGPAGGTVAITGGLTTSTTVAATGNVTGANLAITNWNTAYGWGNHASAGYIKNVVEDTSPQLGGALDLTNYGLVGIHSGDYNSVCADGQDASHRGAFSAWVGTARSRGIGVSHDNTDGFINTTYGNLDLRPATSVSINGAVISYGANDSGGAGYKVLRVPN